MSNRTTIKTWRYLLSVSVSAAGWQSFVPEDIFLQLFQRVQPYLHSSAPKNTKQRTYTKKVEILVTLNLLAHVPTLRQMAPKWGVPQQHC
jgi:hypothetical protein